MDNVDNIDAQESVSSELEDRDLDPKEILDANAELRRRIISALSDHGKARLIMSKEDWDAVGTAKVDYPSEEDPEWQHSFSRNSKHERVIRSQSLVGESLFEETLMMDEKTPAISFSRIVIGKRPLHYHNTSNGLGEAKAMVGRIEQQLRKT